LNLHVLPLFRCVPPRVDFAAGVPLMRTSTKPWGIRT
jgi:hypothetical protein